MVRRAAPDGAAGWLRHATGGHANRLAGTGNGTAHADRGGDQAGAGAPDANRCPTQPRRHGYQ
jgi:hypothetical protein